MKQTLLFILFSLMPLLANAQVEIDGIYYMLRDYETKEAVVVSNPSKYSGDVVIPETVEYNGSTYPVTIINDRAFKECVGLTSVTIPNSVTLIGIGAFFDCTRLTSITIPNNVTIISGATFTGCRSLTSVTIPNSVTSIGLGAFSSCESLTSVTIPHSVTSIDEHAFSRCGLSSITIPNGVTSIGKEAFLECDSLTSIIIPNSVTYIGDRAFEGYYKHNTTVVSLIEDPFIITGKSSLWRTFSNYTFENATLYVPAGTIDKYKSTEGWCDFVNIQEGTGGIDGISSVKADGLLIEGNGSTLLISGADVGTAINVYDTSGRLVGSAQASAGTTTISTSLCSGEIGIVKIGDKAVKVLVQ